MFDTLLADYMPKGMRHCSFSIYSHLTSKVYFNFKQHQISPAVYLPGWIKPVFLDHLPFDACAHIWDILVLEGDSFLFRVSIAILSAIASRLYFPDRKELLEVLRFFELQSRYQLLNFE
jgi:TBC1 domain family member 14